MSYIIKPRRGLKKDLPVLNEHELAVTTDTKEIYVGSSSGNQLLGSNYININYADLVALRDAHNLKKGAFYRITDYETTTVQAETQSAGHLFDIIVQALDEKTLSENASAINSARDTTGYFDGMRLEAWKLKYTLENDRLEYYWADDVNGKGVIYRMIDEYENDLPYDFKNIQFKRYMIDEYSVNTEFEGKYYALKDSGGNTVPNDAVIVENEFIWAYTFTTEVTSDESYIETTTLNKYVGINDMGVTPYCSKNIFGEKSEYMFDLLDEYNSYVLGNNVIYNQIDLIDEEDAMYLYLPNYNTIGNDFYNNTIGNYFYNNTIGNYFYNNTIGNGFNNNTIGNDFYNNTIGNFFYYNTIENDFYNNTIGNSFYNNTIGNSFYNNTIGNSFYNNTIGNDFNNNTIGNNFYYNTIGNYVKYIQFSVDGTFGNPIRYLYLKNGLIGASSANRLDLYYADLYGREYPTTFEIIANGNIVSSWEETPLTRVGKVKATKTTATWSDI